MKRYINVKIPLRKPSAVISCIIMLMSAVIRIVHYIPKEIDLTTLTVHILMPCTAVILFVLGMIAGGIKCIVMSSAAVVMGIAFFIIKAFSFTPLHQTLCTILYVTVLTLYTLTVYGYLPTKKLLYPLFGLPLLYHIFVEDTKLYFFADPSVPVWEWMPEISVLCIMAALFMQSVAMETEKIK